MTGGGIDPEQRRIAERLVLSSLRRFHREQPLSPTLRTDALVARVRAAAARRPPPRHRGATPLTLDDAELRRVIDDLAAGGRLMRDGRRVGLPEHRPELDPEMGARVDRLLEGLAAAGAAPPRVDGLVARLGIPPAVVEQLRAGGVLRQVAPGIDYPADVWRSIVERVEGMGRTRSVAGVRDALRTTRRHAEAILAAMPVTRPAATRRPPVRGPSRSRRDRDTRAVR